MNWSDGWDLEASGSAGHFIGQVPGNANLDIGSSAFGLWANSGGISEAYRMFAMPLGAGDRFMVDFENNFVAIGQQSVGFDLIDDASNVVIGFSFVGGSNVYNVTDAGGLAATAVGWTDQGNTLQYDFTSGSDFTLTVGANIYTGTYSGSLSGVHVWNADGNSGSDYDLYVDSFQYLEPSGPAGTSNDVVIIYRHPLSDTDGDGIEDSWETANCGGSTNCTPDAQTGDGDEYNYLAEYILDYDPAVSNAPFGFAAVLVDGGIMIEFQDASTNRAYTIDYKSDMTPGIDWMVKQGYIAGTNAYMSFGDMDLSKSSGTYRVRVQLP